MNTFWWLKTQPPPSQTSDKNRLREARLQGTFKDHAVTTLPRTGETIHFFGDIFTSLETSDHAKLFASNLNCIQDGTMNSETGLKWKSEGSGSRLLWSIPSYTLCFMSGTWIWTEGFSLFIFIIYTVKSHLDCFVYVYSNSAQLVVKWYILDF